MKTHKPEEKGQIFSTDLMVAATLFLFLISLVLVYSNDVGNRISLIEIDSERDEAAMHATNSLLYSSGKPGNWENLTDLSMISNIGLVKTRNEIDYDKMQRLVDMNQTNYQGVKDLLGLSKYDFRISIIDLQNNQSLAEFGLEPGSEEKVTNINRFAIYNEKNVKLRLKVFG